jgi:nucleotide-binding universal stress UspA family protein
MDYKRILWPTDFSENSKAAMPHVMSLAEKFDASVTVVYVVVEPDYWALQTDFLAGKSPSEISQRIGEEVKKKLSDFCDEHLESCKDVDTHVIKGDPADSIIKLAEQENCDIIVMSSHGYGGLRRWVYGSVTHKVVSNSIKPVLVVRPQK